MSLSLTTRHQWFTHVRLLGPHLPHHVRLFHDAHHHGSFTAAARGGLTPAPACRCRRTYLHLHNSTTTGNFVFYIEILPIIFRTHQCDGREHHRPVQNRGHQPPRAMGKPPPRWRPPPANGPAGTTRPGSCGVPGAARRANTSRPGATAHSARSPPAARAAGPAGHQKEAAMAAAHYPGGLRPHPPGLRPGTPALLRDAPAGQDGCGGRRASPRRPRDGCHGTPAQVKGASGAAGDDAEASPLTSPGNPRRNAGCPTRRCPTPPGPAWRAQPATRRGSWTAQLDRCSIKQSGKMIRPWFRQAAVPWKTAVTQTRASGRIESPPNSGCSSPHGRARRCPGGVRGVAGGCAGLRSGGWKGSLGGSGWPFRGAAAGGGLGVGMLSGGGRPVRVFVSYAHDNPGHEELVRQLWVFLRACGVDARLDLAAAAGPGGLGGVDDPGGPGCGPGAGDRLARL